MPVSIKNKKIVILGASGFIGRALVSALTSEGAKITAVGRNPDKLQRFFPGLDILSWDGRSTTGWSQAVDGAYAVVNLAGESIATRWTHKRKQAILDSRVNSCLALSEAVRTVRKKPVMVLQASAIGIYGDRGEEILTEKSQPGYGYLAEVGTKWERAISIPRASKLAILRFGVVLGNGGFLAKIIPLFRLYAGGHPGSGENYISWVHIEDVTGSIIFLLKNQLGGIYNLTAPQPVTAKELFREVGHALERPSWLPAPEFALKLLYGEMAGEVLLGSQRVLPAALEKAGYRFKYRDIASALQSLSKSLSDV